MLSDVGQRGRRGPAVLASRAHKAAEAMKGFLTAPE
jgi:hypothetical protein